MSSNKAIVRYTEFAAELSCKEYNLLYANYLDRFEETFPVKFSIK